jgi:hypothetical protein
LKLQINLIAAPIPGAVAVPFDAASCGLCLLAPDGCEIIVNKIADHAANAAAAFISYSTELSEGAPVEVKLK